MSALDGQVVLVTGGGRGVGRGISLAAGEAGANVVVSGRCADAVAVVADELGSAGQAVVCDVTVAGDLDRAVAVAVERFGRLDHVVHNAVSGHSSEVVDLDDVTMDLWEEHNSVSLRALYQLARRARSHLVKSKGSLLVLTSPTGFEGSGDLPLYAAVKGAQRGFVKALAREWGGDGVRVNALTPLAVSPALANAFVQRPDLEGRLAAATPLGRIGDPEGDIGPAAAFLCSPAADYITGQTLVVSGGRFTAL